MLILQIALQKIVNIVACIWNIDRIAVYRDLEKFHEVSVMEVHLQSLEKKKSYVANKAKAMAEIK